MQIELATALTTATIGRIRPPRRATANITSGTPWQPFGEDPPTTSVAAQADDPASLLAHYRALIGLRTDHDDDGGEGLLLHWVEA